MIALETAAFSLEHEEEGSAQLFPGVELLSVKGQVNMPDRFKVNVEAVLAFPRTFLKIDIVVVEDQARMTDFINREKWIEVPVESLPFDFADLGRTLSDIILAMEQPEFRKAQVVDGVPSRHIVGTIPSEGLGALIPAADPGYELGLELWIGEPQGLLRRVRIQGKILSTDDPDVVRVLRIRAFDEPVEISLP